MFDLKLHIFLFQSQANVPSDDLNKLKSYRLKKICTNRNQRIIITNNMYSVVGVRILVNSNK
ncbi:hypothetical protein BpHYR1_044429 [Brachionus plicatilis]|uniref:Uncharacterized protein n=1 Tax=Brachionus plicatilis TaxID=10195 RepID=A0A3M7PFN8_BRAPC|nr:hypothetical protein BpHYR1_044429 [Brachionus plicatilis]